ncbi:MAG: hypothetical protein PHE73_08465 [Sulfurovaceae bacterium]|nr:hypothetical protein [Sulfurovaceae bacterium]
MGKRKPGSIADQIDQKLNLTLVKYAELRGIPVSSLKRNYISLTTAQILAQDGIYAPSTKTKLQSQNSDQKC